MKITIRGYLTLKSSIGKQVILIDDQTQPTILDLLQLLTKAPETKYAYIIFDPITGELGGSLAFLLNGRHLAHLPDGARTSLKDGDELSIFPPMAGG